jgi:2-oxoglutarate ferredoxin oxidoreductase subunit alpha
MIRPITVFPFPKKSFAKLDYSKVKAFIDVEMTIPAQMHDDIALEVLGRAPIHEYGRSGGILLDDDGVMGAIREIIEATES